MSNFLSLVSPATKILLNDSPESKVIQKVAEVSLFGGAIFAQKALVHGAKHLARSASAVSFSKGMLIAGTSLGAIGIAAKLGAQKRNPLINLFLPTPFFITGMLLSHMPLSPKADFGDLGTALAKGVAMAILPAMGLSSFMLARYPNRFKELANAMAGAMIMIGTGALGRAVAKMVIKGPRKVTKTFHRITPKHTRKVTKTFHRMPSSKRLQNLHHQLKANPKVPTDK